MNLTCCCGHFHTIDCPHCGCSIYEPDFGQTEWTREEGGIKPTVCTNNGFSWSPEDVLKTEPHPRGGTPYELRAGA